MSVTEAAHIIFDLRGRLSAGVSLDFVVVSRGEFDLPPDRVFGNFVLEADSGFIECDEKVGLELGQFRLGMVRWDKRIRAVGYSSHLHSSA